MIHMKWIIRSIKKILGIYEIEYEYWVNIKDIKIPVRHTETKIGKVKLTHKMKYWIRTGRFESPIILHKDFTLADGYSSIKIAHFKKIDKVPVYFVD